MRIFYALPLAPSVQVALEHVSPNRVPRVWWGDSFHHQPLYLFCFLPFGPFCAGFGPFCADHGRGAVRRPSCTLKMPAKSTAAAPTALRAPSDRAAAARANQERQAALRFNSTSALEQQRLWEQATSSLRGRSAPAPAPSAALTSPRTRSLAEDPDVESGSDAKASSAPAQIPDDAIEAEVLRILIDGDAALC